MQHTEELRVNGTLVPIAGYSISTPSGSMGRSITIALSNPSLAAIPTDADIEFKRGAIVGGVSSLETIMSGGKIDGRTFSVRWIPDERGGFPGDVIEFSSLSPLANKWSLCPNPPVIMYNPATVDATKILPNPFEAIKLNGHPILTKLEPRRDLKLYDALTYAYVTGCGFNRVVTNFPNFPIDRVDFTIEGGFHEAVKGFLSFLEPEIFEYAGNLWIIYTGLGLPSRLPVKVISLDGVVDVVQTLNPEIISNAVILSYRNLNIIHVGEIPDEQFIDDDPIESGAGHSYTRQETRRHITEYKDINSGELVRTEEHEIITKHFAYRDVITVTVDNTDPTNPITTRIRSEGGIVQISEDTLENSYIANNKAGHHRTLYGIYSNPEDYGRDAYGLLHVEDQRILYAQDDQHPIESVISLVETKTSGMVLKETKTDGLIVYTPILEAVTGSIIESDLSQSILSDVPIETITELLRPTSQNQANVQTVIVDHLNGGLRTVPPVQSRVGTRSTFNPNFALPGNRPGYIREMFLGPSVATLGIRKPFTFEVGAVDPAEARKLAEIKLEQLSSPPKRVTIQNQGIDFSLRRGSVVSPPLRSGHDGNFLVTGLMETASGIGTENARRTQTLECKELVY